MALCNLIKELIANLAKSQVSQIFDHKKNVKKTLYRFGKSVWLSEKYIKTKQNLKLGYKYLVPFEILEAVRKQAYKLNLPVKWCIYFVFYVLLLERDVIRRRAIDQKITNQLKFEEENQPE